MDRDAAAAARHLADHEVAAEEACYRAAQLDGLNHEQADNCEDGAHACAYCPWRDPRKVPAAGDRFILPNGKEIEVKCVYWRASDVAKMEYRFPKWRKWDGGRAVYKRSVPDWPRVVAGARLIRQGKKPRSRFGAKYDKQHNSLVLAFNAVNRRLGYPYSENDFSG